MKSHIRTVLDPFTAPLVAVVIILWATGTAGPSGCTFGIHQAEGFFSCSPIMVEYRFRMSPRPHRTSLGLAGSVNLSFSVMPFPHKCIFGLNATFAGIGCK